MEEILDHEGEKIKKQTFARIALLCSSLAIFSIGVMINQLIQGVEVNDVVVPTELLLGGGFFILSILSFGFSLVSIILKEPWGMVKIIGTVLSFLIFLLFVFSMFLAFSGMDI